MSIARHHSEWLSLVEASGPFLSLPVLMQAFPQGLDAHDPEHLRNVRAAHEQWEDNQQERRPDPAIHRAWVEFVLRETLRFPEEVLLQGQRIPADLSATAAEHGETLRPDLVVINPAGASDSGKARLLIQIVPAGQGLDKPLAERHWKASPSTRMMELLHATGVRLGLVTNGHQWMLVNAPRNETTGFISWYANLWLEEHLTLRAFRSLLSVERFFGVEDERTLEALLAQSATDQQEVTDQLGYQVRKAVEVLVQELDRIDKDRNRALLAEVGVTQLYEAALTVMMRLVFLFSAEERELLLLGDELYDQHYAVSTLRAQLRESADQQGEEVLARRSDAWCRLLATFRGVYGGIEHESLRLPAYGGNLFDPDRFPFLEGRASGTSWRDTAAEPLPVNNQIVLHLLEALQILRIKVPGGPPEPRRLSFRALDIEQIGHVYEGLLDHTAVRATSPVLGLLGAKNQEPEVALDELEAQRSKGEKAFLDFLKEETGRSVAALKKALDTNAGPTLQDGMDMQRLLVACDNDRALYERVLPFAQLIRPDTMGYPVVISEGSVYVTSGSDRRTTGTHYTPRSLTEEIVQYTLEPLVYVGVAEGKPREEWRLRSAAELLELKICDVACGSGAFLVQVCRYLAERLVEAWEDAEAQNPGMVVVAPDGTVSQAEVGERPVPREPEERLAIARRVVADRCLYGVDRNSMAVEMAKLSLWLITLQKNRPFTFLDHAIRWGDSLLGVTNFQQLEGFQLDPSGGTQIRLIAAICKPLLAEATAKRRELESFTADTLEDVQRKEALFHEAEAATDKVRFIADLLVGETLQSASKRKKTWARTAQEAEEAQDEALEEIEEQHESLEQLVTEAVAEWNKVDLASDERIADLRDRAARLLGDRRPFHWVLEFPEVFASGNDLIIRDSASPNIVARSHQDEYTHSVWIGDESEPGGRKRVRSRPIGFDAIVGNPPFIGGQKITAALGTNYRDYLVEYIANGKRGSADIVAYFFLRAKELLRADGHLGLVATNTVAQGDTREVGLDQMVSDGSVIYRAVPSRPWSGTAALEVAHVWLRKGNRWNSDFVLEDKVVAGITSLLISSSTATGNPYSLKANQDKAFIGVYVLGMGFVLGPEQASELIAKDKRNKDVLFPYLNGEDLNSRPVPSPSRWVINFRDMPLDHATAPEGYNGAVAADYPDCLRIVEEKVKPERAKLIGRNAIGTKRGTNWWLYGGYPKNLFSEIAGMEYVLTLCRVTKYLSVVIVPTNWICSIETAVFSLNVNFGMTMLQSTLYEAWVRKYTSTLETRLRYSPSDCFENFPFPNETEKLEQVSQPYYSHRQHIMLERNEGLTNIYNRFNDPKEVSEDIVTLRRLHVDIDEAVAKAYDWSDLKLGHDFHQTKLGVRYTISETARREVLDRLLQLNHERYAEEVAAGLHDKGAKKKTKTAKTKKAKSKASPTQQPSMIDM